MRGEREGGRGDPRPRLRDRPTTTTSTTTDDDDDLAAAEDDDDATRDGAAIVGLAAHTCVCVLYYHGKDGDLKGLTLIDTRLGTAERTGTEQWSRSRGRQNDVTLTRAHSFL